MSFCERDTGKIFTEKFEEGIVNSGIVAMSPITLARAWSVLIQGLPREIHKLTKLPASPKVSPHLFYV